MSEEKKSAHAMPIPPPDLPEVPPQAPVILPSAEIDVRICKSVADEESLEAGSPVAFNSRVIAALIDVVLAGGLVMAAIWILPGFAEKIAWLTGAAYLVARDSLPFLGGQSVGKTAMKIKVVTLDDHLLLENWPAAIIRNGVLLIPFFVLVELYVLLSREEKPERGRRLGDEWAKTKVVIAPAPVEKETQKSEQLG